ncbi:anthranilate synthase component I [Ruminococcus gauvreauii]|uniref:Anthranilate synthase component 1 n=1 Tax=Ruminococcus gauvreauii TaxID=438033 RepID=A0ABY5VFE3_9FIRM|nr:anthranilate synthase component I [Ruminococcus gauvreauii]UWP58876.1 anthranilate synthase component I [Ruminococcus gauvreauii]
MKRVLRAYRKTVSIVNESSVALFEGLSAGKKAFLLESYDKNYDRYTFMGVDPEEIIHSDSNGIVIEYRDGSVRAQQGNPLELLKAYYDQFQVTKDDGELPFTGGFVGALGYDFVRYSEDLPDKNPDEIGIETVQFMVTTKYIVIDHVAETLTGVCLREDTDRGRAEGEREAEQLVADARAKMKEAPCTYDHGGILKEKSDTREQYSEKVEKIKEYIREGHIFQTVLSQRWTIETKRSGLDLYKELRILNPSPYLYYFNFGEFEIIGSSPEMLVKQTDNRVYTCPIAGTRPRGRDKAEDERLKKDLLSDEKEKAEHVMLVDLARNDMGRISQFGTVKVTQFMEVQNYSHVMHMVSLVEGRKNGTYHPLDLTASFLPAGTLSGAPKIRAMEIIDELEDFRRGLYGGAVGYIDFNGNMDFCITIRTMIKKGKKVYLQAGAGIVADSVAESEYTECCNKVMALAKTLVKEEHL